MPIFSIFFFVFTIFNAGIPLSLNWAGEFICLTGAFQRNPIFAFFGSTGIVLSAAYSIWLYNRIAFGSWSNYLNYTTDLSRREFMLILPLFLVSIIFGFFPNIILNTIHISVSTLLFHLI
jgi:NADH-ubiquinone oxidoreductase chain 4